MVAMKIDILFCCRILKNELLLSGSVFYQPVITAMTNHRCRRINEGDRGSVIAMLTRAFFGDPLLRWLYPDDDLTKKEPIAPFFT